MSDGALEVSRASWKCVQSGDRSGWLALMAEGVLIEDPIGPAITNTDGLGVRGKEAVAAFYDANIAPNTLTVTCEESFPSSDPREVAHLLVLRTEFPGELVALVRGVFTYVVGDDGLLTNLRGYWNSESVTLTEKGKS